MLASMGKMYVCFVHDYMYMYMQVLMQIDNIHVHCNFTGIQYTHMHIHVCIHVCIHVHAYEM